MSNYLDDDFETIDAAVFSGDFLEDEDNRENLREYCERWLRAINNVKYDD